MALTDEQIAQGQKYLKVWQQCTSLPMVSHHLVFAQTIEAEVRKDDEALIRMMLDALDDLQGYRPDIDAAITAAKKRLNHETTTD